jgi:hypothetical protein
MSLEGGRHDRFGREAHSAYNVSLQNDEIP